MGTHVNKRSTAEIVAEFDRLPDAARVSIVVVAALYDIGPATVWRRLKDGLIPAPRQEGGGTKWIVGDLRKALAVKAPPTVRPHVAKSVAKKVQPSQKIEEALAEIERLVGVVRRLVSE